MSYDKGTPLLSIGRLDAGQIDAAFRARNANAPPLGAAIVAEAAASGVNGDFVAAEIGCESGWWTSDRATRANNPSGLGATDDGAWGAVFADPADGVHATFAHWRSYIEGAANPWWRDDPRWQAVQTSPHFGLARVIGDIGNGLWATDDVYAETVLGILAEIAPGGPADDGPVVDPQEDAVNEPWDRIHWAADVGPQRPIASVKWFVVHDTEGRFAGDENILSDAGGPIESVHFLVGRQPGQCLFMVPLDKTAWTAGNDAVSRQAVQVELSQVGGEGYTDYQYETLALIFRYCVAQGMNVPALYLGRRDADGGMEPDVPGIIGHQDVPDGAGGWGGSGHHTDPGPLFDWGKFVGLIAGAPLPPPVADDSRFFAETGHAIAGNIKGYWERFGDDKTSIEIFGFPISDLAEVAGVPTQYFERQVLEDRSGQVLGRRLGAWEALADGLSGPGVQFP